MNKRQVTPGRVFGPGVGSGDAQGLKIDSGASSTEWRPTPHVARGDDQIEAMAGHFRCKVCGDVCNLEGLAHWVEVALDWLNAHGGHCENRS